MASIRREIDQLASEYAAAEEKLRRERPDAMAVNAPQPLSADAIQHELLDPGTVLVEYMLGDAQSYAWTVSRDTIASYRLPARAEIIEAARQAHDAFAAIPGDANDAPAGRDPSAAADRLARLLLPPIEHVAAGKRLVIVAPGDLQQLPFGALRAGRSRTPLIARHEIVLAPSASIVAAVRQTHAQARRAPRTLAVFADPVFEAGDPRVAAARRAAADRAPARVVAATSAEPRMPAGLRSGFARLPFSRMEADAIASLAPAGSVLEATDFNASVRAATAPSLVDYRIVHFATHGVLDTRTPELSGLVLSLIDREGRPQDGFIRLLDLDRLHLNADVAVLSGCETALGRSVEGEGVIGLTRGFLAAGAHRVVASVWKVDDLATAELMKRFYRGMLEERKSPSAALRAAQRELAQSPRWHAPYYWAGWVIQGEWR